MCNDDSSGRIAAFVCAVLAVCLIVILFFRFRPDRKVRWLPKLSLRFQVVFKQISLRAKIKYAARPLGDMIALAPVLDVCFG